MLVLLQGMALKVQQSGFRINLRPLGEKQTLAWLPVCYFTFWAIFKLANLIAGAE